MKGTENLTRQSQIFKTDPKLTKEMAAAARKTLI